jgi:hypothetical protein
MIYEDCSFHPCLCTSVAADGEVNGISLIDGSAPRACDLENCGVEVLTVADVLAIRQDFDAYRARRSAEVDGVR